MLNWKTVWTNHFGDKDCGYDYAGRYICFSEYGSKTSSAWNIEHIRPSSIGGTDRYENLIPVHVVTNAERANKPAWVSNTIPFEYIKGKGIRNKRTGKIVS
ncbi:HNH endonuclease signature motif containing protein [Mycoplasma sp. AC157]